MKVAFRKAAKSWYSFVIRLYTRGPFSHCELVFSDGQCFSSQEGEGSRFKLIDLKPAEWDLVDVLTDERVESQVRAFCESEKGCEYDWRGISFSFLPIPIGWQHPDKWFCSEICTAGLQVAGYMRGYTPASVSPNQLYKCLYGDLGAS